MLAGAGPSADKEELLKMRQMVGNSLAVAVKVLSPSNISDSIISLTVARPVWHDHARRFVEKKTAKDHAKYAHGIALGDWVKPLKQVFHESLHSGPNLVRMGVDCVGTVSCLLDEQVAQQDGLVKKISNLAVPSASQPARQHQQFPAHTHIHTC